MQPSSRRRLLFSRITSCLVAGLVLSYVFFIGYVLTVTHQSNAPPARIATVGCFSLGHCTDTRGNRPN
jgi:ABC-type transport system involved in multi-copper enzyme maturation permease subunit